MLVVVSPAKKFDMGPMGVAKVTTFTQPIFPAETIELADVAGKLSTADLKKLMGISDKLADLNKERFVNFGTQSRKPAALAFAGDTYQGLNAESLDIDEMNWAQDHLRIISGLYGLLRPLDEIEPYRLEMGSRLTTKKGKTLYDYWGGKLAEALNLQGQKTKSNFLVNCASKEYFSAIDQTCLKMALITPVFMENTKTGPKIVSFYAKKARGAMARFIVTKRIKCETALRDFEAGGYHFSVNLSSDNKPVFIR